MLQLRVRDVASPVYHPQAQRQVRGSTVQQLGSTPAQVRAQTHHCEAFGTQSLLVLTPNDEAIRKLASARHTDLEHPRLAGMALLLRVHLLLLAGPYRVVDWGADALQHVLLALCR
jgi:hypothetical protein